MPGNPWNLSIPELQEKARLIRRHIISMAATAGSGHPSSALSAADIVTALYFKVMHHDPHKPLMLDRDRFILSKGHGVPVVYAVLAEAGYIPLALLSTLRQLGSSLQGHPSYKDLPLVEASTGSLGQGLSIGIGMALAAKLDASSYRVYVMIGDGESDEGQVWAAAETAPRYHLDNLTVIMDYNKYQLDDAVERIMSLEPIVEKWQALGWHTQEIDGHNMEQVVEALTEAQKIYRQPSIIVAHTVKGKGVSFMGGSDFHGRAPTPEQAELALRELGF